MERSFIEELTAYNDKETMNEVKSLSVSLKKGFVKRALQAQVVKDNINKSPYPVIVLGTLMTRRYLIPTEKYVKAK